MSSNYSKDWQIHELSDVCYFQEGPGLRNWQYRESGIKFINIRCIKEGGIDTSIAQCLASDEVHAKYEHFLLDEDDIVLSSSGTIGRAAVVRKEDLPLLLNTSVIRFRPLKYSLLDREYLYYFLQSRSFLEDILEQSQGSAQVNFGPTHLKQLQILLPPLPEQKKIAEILSGIDANLYCQMKKAKKCQKLIAAMEGNAFTVFRKDDLIRHRLVSDKGSQVVSLGDIFDFRNGLNYSKGNAGTGLKVVGVGDFKNYRTPKYETLGELSPEGLDFGLSLLEEGDFLFVRSNGNRLLIGRCLSIERIPGGIPIVHSGFTIRARPKCQNSYSTNYIKQLLQSHVFRRSVADLGGGTNISNLSQDILAETMIAFPSTSVQEKVSSGLLAIQDFYELTQAKLKQLEATKVALTSDLLSGRKRVSI